MKRFFSFLILLAPVLFSLNLVAQSKVFVSGDGGYKSFRIPAILKAPNGDLLAFCEGRLNGSSDFGNIKIVLKRSADNGKTWRPLQVVASNDSLQAGNPAPVVDLTDPEFPWLGITFAAPIVGIWYWCTDQHIVQRCLAGRDERQARRGTIFAAYLKLLPFFIFLVPGLIATALHQQGKLDLQVNDEAFPTLVKALMPIGLRGLLAGGLLAALMSSLASVYNACSTLFTMDIYQKIKPEANGKELVKVGRIATGVVVLLGMAWIPLMSRISGTLYQYLQSVQSYLAPPIAAVFLLGVFFKRINGAGALTGMVVGFVLGIVKLTLELFQNDLTGALHAFATINFLYFCIYLFLFSIVLMVVVSLLTPKPDEEKIRGLTFATTVAEDRAASRASWNKWDVILSLIVLAIVISVFVYFSPLGVAG